MAAIQTDKNNANEVWKDTFDKGYIHQFQPKSTHEIQKQRQKYTDEIDYV